MLQLSDEHNKNFPLLFIRLNYNNGVFILIQV